MTTKKSTKTDEVSISLEDLSREGNIQNKGKRKSIKHLWSSKEYPLERYKNIVVPIEIVNDVRRDSYFFSHLSSLSEYLERNEECIEDEEDAKSIVNFELLLYMGSKCFKSEEYPLENLFLVFSGFKKAMPKSWDLTIADKINVLFKNHFSKTFILSLYEAYNKIHPMRRLFDIEEDEIAYIKSKKDIESLGKYQKKYDSLMESKESILKNLDQNSHAADIVQNALDNDIRYCKNLIKELSSEKYTEFRNVKLKKGTVNYNGKTKLFDNIIASDHPYIYTTVLMPFPDANQCEKNKIFLTKSKGIGVEKGPYINEELKYLYTKKSMNAVHTFEMTKYIEKRKREKRNLNLDSYTFNLQEAATMLDDICGGNGWKERIKGICFKKVIWADSRPVVKMDPNYTMTLKEASHIIGMLGAGKTTFMRLLNFMAVKNGLKTAIITNKKESSIENYLNLLDDNKNLLNAYGRGKVSIFTGYSKREDSIKHAAMQVSNVLSGKKKLDDAINDGVNIFDVTECSSIIASKYKRLFDEEYKDSLETIPCSKSKTNGTFKVANIEYKENAIYRSLEKLVDSDTWIGNIHAFLKTKCPYQLDMFCRDFLTIVNIVADIVIIDEIDEIQSIADENYNVDYGIATSFAKNSDNMVVDYLYREMVGVDRSVYRYEIDKIHGSLILEQQGICDSILSYLSKNERRANREYKHFSYYSLKVKFIQKYFKVEAPTTNQITKFSRIIGNTDILPHEGFNGSKLKEKMFWLSDIILRRKEASIIHKNKFDRIIAKRHIDKAGYEYGGIDFYDVTDRSAQIAYRNLHMFEVLNLIAEHFEWEIDYDNVLKSLDENKSRLNSIFTSDFEFLVLIASLDNNQTRIDSDTASFANRVGMKFDMSKFTKATISPLFPDPLVKRAYTYSYKAPSSKESAHRLNIKNYMTVGRDILFNYRNSVETLEKVKAPIYVVMSASSYFNQSSCYNVDIKPSYIIKNDLQNDTKIDIKKKFIKFGDNLIKISGSKNSENKKENLENMFTELVRENFFDKEIKYLEEKYEESQQMEDEKDKYTQRQIVGIAVPSYEIAEIIARHLIKTQSKHKVKCLFSENKKIMSEKIEQKDYHVKVDEVGELCKMDCDIFVFVMPAIGRGYNVLQKKSKYSLMGTIMFPVRPFMHPEDEMYMIYALHSEMDNMIEEAKRYSLDKYGKIDGFLVHKRLKRNAMLLYDKMFNSTNFWKSMNEELKYWMVANFLVSILQTMGRGMRGGTDLRVYLMDASFISDRAIKAIEESEANIPVDIEEDKTESFVSVCTDILSKGDEIFNLVNKPLVDGFKNIEWGI